jgi:cytidine deaminase
MERAPLTAADRELVETVTATNRQAFDPAFFDGAHIVAAGVRTSEGGVFEGVSLPASVGRASMCAEPVAIGAAIAAGHRHDDIATCVAVSSPMDRHDATEHRVVPPCGSCRELLVDHNESMRVVVPADGGERVVAASDLLPVRTW